MTLRSWPAPTNKGCVVGGIGSMLRCRPVAACAGSVETGADLEPVGRVVPACAGKRHGRGGWRLIRSWVPSLRMRGVVGEGSREICDACLSSVEIVSVRQVFERRAAFGESEHHSEPEHH